MQSRYSVATFHKNDISKEKRSEMDDAGRREPWNRTKVMARVEEERLTERVRTWRSEILYEFRNLK